MEDLFTYGRTLQGFFLDSRNSAAPNWRPARGKGFAPPKHRFFDCCEDLHRASQDLESVSPAPSGLKVKLFKEVGEELSKKKLERNVQTFDDLLLKLQAALEGRGGRDLIIAIRRKYRAALIDEFQDTDPVQYAIFQSLFGRGGSILFLVGTQSSRSMDFAARTSSHTWRR